jgi:hypothetical protein
MTDFNTSEKFLLLYESIMIYNLGFMLFGEEKYLQHNISILQKILRTNKLPSSLLNPKKIFMTRHKQSPLSSQSNMSQSVIVERYDNDIDLKNLVVPTSSKEDTDTISGFLSTPDPDEYVEEINKEIATTVIKTIVATIPPTKKTDTETKTCLSTGAKVWIGIAIFMILVGSFMLYAKPKKITKKYKIL